jgi:hypothetical protein
MTRGERKTRRETGPCCTHLMIGWGLAEAELPPTRLARLGASWELCSARFVAVLRIWTSGLDSRWARCVSRLAHSVACSATQHTSERCL